MTAKSGPYSEFRDSSAGWSDKRTYYWHPADNSGDFITTGPLTGPFDEMVDFRTGIRTPNFRELSEQGVIVMSPGTKVVRRTFGGGGVYNGSSSSGASFDSVGLGSVTQQALFEEGPIGVPPLNWSPDWLLKEAKLNALRNIDKTPTAFSEDIVEWKDTLALLRAPIQGITDMAKEFNQTLSQSGGVWKSAAAFKSSMKLWLQVKFNLAQVAWTGMAIDDAYQRALLTTAVDLQRRRYRSLGLSEHAINDSGDYLSAHKFVYKVSRQLEAKTRAMIYYQYKSQWVAEFRDSITWKYGLSLKDVMPTVWAVSRLSWLVDGFVPVGASIRAVQNLLDPEIEILGACVSQSVKSRESVTVLGFVDGVWDPSWTISMIGDEVGTKVESNTRNVWVPTLFDTVPGIRPLSDIKGTTLFDSVAVAAQHVRTMDSVAKKAGLRDLGWGVRSKFGDIPTRVDVRPLDFPVPGSRREA